MDIRNCRIDERDKAINLINEVFRIKAGLAPTMGAEFLCLLGEKNIENTIACVDNEEIVGCVNYYQSNISIEGSSIKVSSIGAVCTREDYRGRNIICDILQKGDIQALDKKSCILLISGNRKVYLNHGACEATLSRKFTITNSDDYDIQLKEYEDYMFDDILKLYNKEPIRFERERGEFKELLKGSMFNWGNNINKLFMVFKNNVLKGYIMVNFQKDSKDASVKELAGNRYSVFQGLHLIKNKYSLKNISVSVPINDELVDVMRENNIDGVIENQWGTVKIIDLKGLIEGLKPYFKQYIHEEELNKFKIEVDKDKYKFIYEDEELVISNTHDLNRLVLGAMENKEEIERIKRIKAIDLIDNVENEIRVSNLEDLKDGNLKRILKKMFPIPFPNIFGMNFQ